MFSQTSTRCDNQSVIQGHTTGEVEDFLDVQELDMALLKNISKAVYVVFASIDNQEWGTFLKSSIKLNVTKETVERVKELKAQGDNEITYEAIYQIALQKFTSVLGSEHQNLINR